jgi:hypothetical protein
VVRRHGLKTKSDKSKTYSASSPKEVTGAVIAGANLRLPNKQHKKIQGTRLAIAEATDRNKLGLQLSLRGRLQQAQQILQAKSI